MVTGLGLRTLALALFVALAPAAAGGRQAARTPVAPVGEAGAAPWREDLRHLAAELVRVHRNAFHTVPRERFEAEVRELDARIPSLARHQIAAELARIVALVGDGHTVMLSFPFSPELGSRVYPVGLYQFADGVYVHAADPKYAAAVGGKVVSIGGTPVDVAIERMRPYIARDNEMGVRLYAPLFFSSPEALHAAGVVADMERVPLVVEKGGRSVTATLEPAPAPAVHHFFELIRDGGFLALPGWADAREPGAAPLWAKNPREYFWFEYLPDSRAVYVQYNAVANKENETVEAFARRLYEFVASNPVDRLVFDVRRNGGGNNFLNRPFMLGLVRSTKVDQPGKVFVLTGRVTFSAAQNFSNLFEKFTNATFAGEPTGGSPNHYGDAARITLPNSKLVAQASTLWWQDMDPRDRRPWIGPAVAAEMTFDDYRANRDPVLEAALRFVPQPPITAGVRQALDAKDPARAGALFRAYVTDPAHKYATVEGLMNTLGYQLMGAGRVADAVVVFKMIVDAYPDSWNAWDSLAEGSMNAGDRENAIKFYEKSLQLNPKNAGGRAALEKLRSGQKD